MIMERVILLVVVMIIMSQPPVTDAERYRHVCDCGAYSHDCPDCDISQGRCCSSNGYCGAGPGYCSVCTCGGVTCHACHCDHSGICSDDDQKLSEYRGDNNYKYHGNISTNASTGVHHHNENTLVATYNRNLYKVSAIPNRTVHEYGSAAICGPSSSSTTTVSTNIGPGQCLQVTNNGNGKQVKVRITDKLYCSKTSLALDYDVFQQLLGTSTASKNLGAQLPVSYKYVKCTDN